jgi:hypothetical protein
MLSMETPSESVEMRYILMKNLPAHDFVRAHIFFLTVIRPFVYCIHLSAGGFCAFFLNDSASGYSNFQPQGERHGIEDYLV